MSQQVIPTGKYIGWTLARLEARLVSLQTDVEGGGGNLTGASVNGQSFQFDGTRDGGSLAGQLLELQAALHYLAPHKYWCPPSDSAAVRLV
jgi:hypothetical protein